MEDGSPLQGVKCRVQLFFGLLLTTITLLTLALQNSQSGRQIQVLQSSKIWPEVVDTVHYKQAQQNWEKIFLFPSNDSHIIVHEKLRGRLGNKIFILASMLGIAYKNNMTIWLTSFFDSLKDIFKLNVTRRLGTATSFNQLNARKVDIHSTSWCSNVTDDLWRLHRNISLTKGFLQCFPNFEGIKGFLYDELDFNDKLKSEIRAYLRGLIPQVWIAKKTQFVQVGVHVRRGDFTGSGYQKSGFSVAPKEYFQHAMDFINQRYVNVQYFVATDDIPWCKVNLNSTNIVFSSLKKPAEDLAALVLCDHIIMSTGTFGWWAGYLNRGTVIYYKHYPRPGSDLHRGFNSSQYYPPQWIGML